MAMTINTNVNSLTAQRNAINTQNSLATSMQRLSSGLRVNSAKDVAAGIPAEAKLMESLLWAAWDVFWALAPASAAA